MHIKDNNQVDVRVCLLDYWIDKLLKNSGSLKNLNSSASA